MGIRFHSIPSFVQKLFPSLIWSKPNVEQKVYLTFDDGPVPEITPWVLDQLAQFKAQASFFCVGENIEKHPAVFESLVSAGHLYGNHTFHHVKGWNVSWKNYIQEISLFDEVVEKQGFPKTVYFRPPYGRLKSGWKKHLKPELKIIMWDVLTCDYDQKISPETCWAKTKKHVESGSVIVFHDSVKSKTNLYYVLPKLLAMGKSLGWKFCRLDQ